MAVASNPLESFIWGAGGQKMSPEQVARQREMAAALMQGGMDYSPVNHWLQGAARASQGLVGGLKDRWAGEAEQAGKQGFQSQWDSVFGGGGSPVAAALAGGGNPALSAIEGIAPTAGAPASVPTGDNAAYIRQGLTSRGLPEHVADAFLLNFQDESGLNPGINEAKPTVPGSRGGYGLYQLTGPRRRAYEAFAAERGIPVDSIDGQLDFLMGELAGSESAAAKKILSAADTPSAAAAIVNSFLRPAEEHRARREAAYLGGAGGAAQGSGMSSGAPQGATPSVAQLLALSGNEWANPGQSNVINALLNQGLQQQDPAYQQQMALRDIQMQQEALKLQQMQTPSAPEPIKLGDMLLDPITFEPLFDARNPVTATVGSSVIDTRTGQPIYQGGPEPTANMRDYDAYAADELAAGREPIGRLAYEQEVRKAGASSISVGGVSQTPGDDKFYETLGGESAKRYSAMIDQGEIARRNLAQLDVAGDLLQTAPQGPMGLATLFAGQFGIDLGGLNETQALNAVINQMVPAQRAPGSGPMSDKDIDMYRGSVVSLANKPGGNALILETARAINQYDIQMGEIAGMVEDGLLTRAEGRAQMAALPNPIDGFREARKKIEGGQAGTTIGQSQANPSVMNQTGTGVTWSFVD